MAHYRHTKTGGAARSEQEAYLQSVQNSLSPRVFEFATAPWHYDHTDHRCTHDGWLESLTIREIAEGDRRQHRRIEIELLLLGAFHDGHTRMTYRAVSNYSITLPTCESPFENKVAHGDWLVDEFRLSTNGLIVHMVSFSSGSRSRLNARILIGNGCLHYKQIRSQLIKVVQSCIVFVRRKANAADI